MMTMYILMAIIGLIIEIAGAGILVKQSICFAKITEIPKTYAAMFLCGMGSGLYFFIDAVIKSMKNAGQEISSSAVVTVLFSVLLILAICAMTGKMKIRRGVIQQELSFFIFVQIVLLYLSADYLFHGKHSMRILSRTDGIVLLIMFVIFFGGVIKKTFSWIKAPKNVKINLPMLLLCGLGILFVTCGEFMMLYFVNKTGITEILQKEVLQQLLDSVMLIFPCFVISMWLIKYGEMDLVIGNVIGYGMMSVAASIGAAVIIQPIMVSVSEIYDMIMLCCASVMVWLFAYKYDQLSRLQGCIMATVFVIYMIGKI